MTDLPIKPIEIELKPMPDDTPEPSSDMSYIIVAVDSSGSYFILDAADGFTDREVIQMHQMDEDTGVALPKEIVNPGVYRLTDPTIETTTDWESGHVDDVWVEASKFEVLWEQAS